MLGFAGVSHLGVVSSVCWASLGYRVIGVDPDANTISALAAGKLPIYEPQLAEMLSNNQARLEFTDKLSFLAACDVDFLSLDTDTDEANVPALAALEQLTTQVIPWLATGASAVLMCQVPVGYTRQPGQKIRAIRPDLAFDLYYWVGTLVVGNAVEGCLRRKRIVFVDASRI